MTQEFISDCLFHNLIQYWQKCKQTPKLQKQQDKNIRSQLSAHDFTPLPVG